MLELIKCPEWICQLEHYLAHMKLKENRDEYYDLVTHMEALVDEYTEYTKANVTLPLTVETLPTKPSLDSTDSVQNLETLLTYCITIGESTIRHIPERDPLFEQVEKRLHDVVLMLNLYILTPDWMLTGTKNPFQDF